MRRLKGALSASACGVLAIQVAQSADRPLQAGPVQYVKICTLYGDGFYYIPGSDTCIRFGGYVRSDYGYNVTGARTPHYSGAAGAQSRTVGRYSTRHRGTFQIDARTQTHYGTLRTFQGVHASNESEDMVDTRLARAFIQWGGWTIGRVASFTDQYGTISRFLGLHQTQNDSYTSANGTNQIAYTWQLGAGVTLNAGADERRAQSIANWSVNSTTVGADPTTFRHGQTLPNPWVVLRVNQAWGDASIGIVGNHNQATHYTAPGGPGTCAQAGTALCGHPDDKWGWAFISGIEIKLPSIGLGDRVGGYFNYGVGAMRYSGGFALASPGLFGSGNTVALGVVTDAVFVNGSDIQQTTAWSTGAHTSICGRATSRPRSSATIRRSDTETPS
jgi:Porin subfamily